MRRPTKIRPRVGEATRRHHAGTKQVRRPVEHVLGTLKRSHGNQRVGVLRPDPQCDRNVVHAAGLQPALRGPLASRHAHLANLHAVVGRGRPAALFSAKYSRVSQFEIWWTATEPAYDSILPPTMCQPLPSELRHTRGPTSLKHALHCQGQPTPTFWSHYAPASARRLASPAGREPPFGGIT